MFLLIAIGVVLVKCGLLSEQGGKDLGAILLRVVIPCVIVKSYITEYTPERARELAISGLLAAIALAVAAIVSQSIFGKKKLIENFGASYCNVGFIGIPLVQSVLGEGAVFYMACFIAMLNVLQWTYGIFLLTGDRNSVRFKTIITIPVVVAFIVGLVVFFLQIPVPELIVSVLGSVANMNTPLAMIILGTYVARSNLKEILTAKSAYVCTFVRLVLIPVVTLIVLLLIPGVRTEIKLVVLIACSTPVGSNIAIFAKQYDMDYQLSVATVCLSTLLCIVTVPVYYMLVERVMLG